MRGRNIICGLFLCGAVILAARQSGAQTATPVATTTPSSGAAVNASAARAPSDAVKAAGTVGAPAAVPAAPPEEDKADTPDNADPTKDPLMSVSISQSMQNLSKLREPDVKPQELSSLFFTLWQYQLLQDSKRLYHTHPVSPADLAKSGETNPAARPRAIRELSVGGIVYRSSEDWTVYLNGQRVTQDKNTLPDQVMDIKVTEDHIDLKWFDTFTNLIFPVRLREHQRFNLDARMFITGQGTQTAGTQ